MKKSITIILLVTILIPALYQNAPAQVFGNSSTNSLGGNLTQRRGSSMLSLFSRYSTGSDQFRQTLNRLPDPLAARKNVNRLLPPLSGQSTGFSRRTSTLGLSSQISSFTGRSTLTGMSGYGAASRPMGLTASGTGFNVRGHSTTSPFSYSQPRRFFGGSYLSGRSFANYPSIFTTNLPQNTLKPSLLDKRGLLSSESYSLLDRKSQSDLVNTRLSATNSFFGSPLSSPFLRVRKY